MQKKHSHAVKSTPSFVVVTPLPYLTVSKRVTKSVSSNSGDVIRISGHGNKKRFTVRKMSGNVGVERIFPIESPFIEEIVVNRRGKVRRAKLYYLRALTGKKARIKERRV